MQNLQNATESDRTEGSSGEIPERIDGCLKAPKSVGDEVAWMDSTGSWTERGLAEVMVEMESWLLYLGIRSGDRVMIVSAHCRAFVALLLALVRIDAFPVLVDASLSAKQVDQLRANCEPRRVFYMISSSQPAKLHAIRHNAEFINPVEWGPVAFSELHDGTKRALEVVDLKRVAARF